MLAQEYHVAYYIGVNLLSGVNVIAHDEIEAMAKAYELKRLNYWRVCYVHAKETKVVSMMTEDIVPLPFDYFYSKDIPVKKYFD